MSETSAPLRGPGGRRGPISGVGRGDPVGGAVPGGGTDPVGWESPGVRYSGASGDLRSLSSAALVERRASAAAMVAEEIRERFLLAHLVATWKACSQDPVRRSARRSSRVVIPSS